MKNYHKNPKKISCFTFDLFKLHIPDEDITPRSWICFNGKNLHKIVTEMLAEIQSFLHISKKKLIQKIANLLNCSKTCVSYRVYNINKNFPIIMVEAILKLWKAHLNKNHEQFTTKKDEIIENTDVLIQNHSKTRPVLAVKTLTFPLCKFAGAHAADGTLIKRDSLVSVVKLSQKDKQDALVYSMWVKESFDFEPCMNIEKHCYSIKVYNKVIARYLHLFLDFPYGHKSVIVVTPKIIKDLGLEYQKAFACGVMTFEGSYEMTGEVSYGGLSKILRDELVETFIKSGLEVKKRNYKNKVFLFRTPKLNIENSKEWLKFFALNTKKWWKIQDIIHGFNASPNSYEDAKKVLNSIYNSRTTSLINVIDFLYKMPLESLILPRILRNQLDIPPTKLSLFLKLLRKMNIVIPIRRGIFLDDNLHRKLFNNRSALDIARLLNVKRKEVQHWKDQDNSIPLKYVDPLLSLINSHFKEVKDSARITFCGQKGYYFNPHIQSWKLLYRPYLENNYSKCQST